MQEPLAPAVRAEEISEPLLGVAESSLDVEVSVGDSVETGADDLPQEAGAAEAGALRTAAGLAPADDSLDIPMTEVGLHVEPDLERDAASLGPSADVPIVSVDVNVPSASRRPRRVLVIGGVLAGAAILVGLLLAVSGKPTATLVVSVLDPEGDATSSADVFVDGQLRCQSSPCKVEGIEPGPHDVSVSGVEASQSAKQPIEVQASGTTHLSIRLPAEASPQPAQTAAPSDETRLPARTGADDVEDLTPADSDEEAPSRGAKKRRHGKKGQTGARGKATGKRPEEPASPDEPAPAGGEGGLMVMSEPSGMVYVDGRAYGPSPRQIRLPAGPHTVTVRHPDRGEHSASVNVVHGKTVSVMLNL